MRKSSRARARTAPEAPPRARTTQPSSSSGGTTSTRRPLLTERSANHVALLPTSGSRSKRAAGARACQPDAHSQSTLQSFR